MYLILALISSAIVSRVLGFSVQKLVKLTFYRSNNYTFQTNILKSYDQKRSQT